MQVPPPNPDTLFAELLQDVPPAFAALAYEFKAFARARKIRTVDDLLRVVLLYCGVDQSLREVAGTMTMLNERITDTAIAQRLTACGPWVKALLPVMLQREGLAHLPAGMRLVVCDATTVQGPGATGTQYRLHLALDLVTLEFIAITVTDKHGGETLKRVAISEGDVVIADRGYAHCEGISSVVERGGEVIVRYHPKQVPLCAEDGARINIVKEIRGQSACSLRTIHGYVQSPAGGLVKVYVHAYRLSPKDAAAARRRLRRNHRKSKSGPRPETVLVAGWVMVVTTIPPAKLAAETVLQIYRLRWQVELVIKRWKSILDVDQLRSREGSPLAEVWLHGKMLYVLMVERRGRRLVGAHWDRLDAAERRGTWWRVWKMIEAEVGPLITGSASWNEHSWKQCQDVLSERRRKRKLQQLPHAAVIYIEATAHQSSRELLAAA